MQYRPVFGAVDALAIEHAGNPAVQILGPGQIEQQGQRLLRNPVLGVVQAPFRRLDRHPLRPPGIVPEQVAQVRVFHGLGVRFQRAPLLGAGQSAHGAFLGGVQGSPLYRSARLQESPNGVNASKVTFSRIQESYRAEGADSIR